MGKAVLDGWVCLISAPTMTMRRMQLLVLGYLSLAAAASSGQKNSVQCCCEGCSPGGCTASISTIPQLNSTDQCETAEPGIHGYCNNSTLVYNGTGAAAGSSYCKPEPIEATTERNYTVLPESGDCCPGDSGCKAGTGPYAVSTGGDYPQMTKKVCDSTSGCLAFGQMFKYVTRYHFSSRDTCEASARSNQSLGDYHCNEAPISPVALSEYLSVVPMHAKLPFSCYTTSS